MSSTKSYFSMNKMWLLSLVLTQSKLYVAVH